MDWWSLIFSSIGFGSMLYGFSEVGNSGWGSPVVIGGVIIGAIFVAHLSNAARSLE
jgi:hypothetical protein